jgi:Predicted transcriptional regulators
MIQEINLSDIEVNRTTVVTPQAIKAMAKDIEANGLQRPLIVDRWGLLIDGLTRLRALEQLGVRKVNAEVANDLHEALAALQELQFDPRLLPIRRRRDFAESLDQLISEHIRGNLRGRRLEFAVKPPQTRELVGAVLGYSWFRIRRVFRWLEEVPTDPYRRELLEQLEAGVLSPNHLYVKLAEAKAPVAQVKPRAIPMGKLRVAGGDIITAKDQRHLLKELNRQLSAAVKGAAKLALPINIPTDELDGYITQLAQSRAALSVFIKSLRNEAAKQ